jgi:hypothetical protein
MSNLVVASQDLVQQVAEFALGLHVVVPLVILRGKFIENW